MLRLRLILTLALSAAVAILYLFGNLAEDDSITVDLLGIRQDDDLFDRIDLPFIKKLAAIGDSYSAGIGAGNRLGTIAEFNDPQSDYPCSRYDHSYPYLINNDQRLGDPSQRSFQFRSCSGAVVEDVLAQQIPRIDANQDVILLSIGGNDMELVNILNQCIFQWGVFNQEQTLAAKSAALKRGFKWAADYDWESLGRGCEDQLDRTQSIIDSSDFSSKLDSVLDSAKGKLAKDGMIYYTGYAKFFAEDLTANCDSVTWATWLFKLYNIQQPYQYLTRDNRKRMNDLVDNANQKLSEAAERAGSSVRFVDYDEHVGYFGGRYCEAGVNEATSENNTRNGLMFYEANTADPFGNTPWKRSSDGHTNGSFEGLVNILAQITHLVDPDAEFIQWEGNQTEMTGTASAAAPDRPQGTDIPEIEVDNILPDGYGRVFHPQILLHRLIADRVIFEMMNRNEQQSGFLPIPEKSEIDSCPCKPPTDLNAPLRYKDIQPGRAVKPGTELRILCVGDSITTGYLSDRNGGDGNGYRLQLRNDLSRDKVVFAGTETSGGTMTDGYFAAWDGRTIQYISDHVGPSLEQRPNIILLHAGTNDMNPASAEGNDPNGAADRLGKLIDQMIKECPDAVVLVAMIINTCNWDQEHQTLLFQPLIPNVVKQRRDAGHHVLAVDFTTFPLDSLQDCIHPTNEGYKTFGNYWYDFITQVPKGWISDPIGLDPNRTGANANGGYDRNIPAPDWGVSPIQPSSGANVSLAATKASQTSPNTCKVHPTWYATGRLALGGIGHNGAWQYKKNWVEAGKVADGLRLDPSQVRLHDMNGDGKADYVWIEPRTGEIRCWLNNLPDPWKPAGTNHGIIGSGRGPADSVFIADMNGDGLEDYMIVNENNGAVHIWWNYGADDDCANGWKFVDGGQIASGIPHANFETLRFPDINGDGRADYVYIGAGGSLRHFMNTGSVGGQDVLFLDQGGIATGAAPDETKLVFADMDGDGRDDYLIWDDEAGLAGFLNQKTQREGVPLYVDQGPAKTIADGITQNPKSIRLADLDGDGKDDYAYVDGNGAVWLWYNRGTADTSMTIDGLHFADIDGDGRDDYVWLDPATGAPTVYINGGPAKDDPLGWLWSPLNNGKPVAPGAAPASQVRFGDIDGDGSDDYLVLDPKTGNLTVYLNAGKDSNSENGWRWNPIGSIAGGLGPGRNVRFADIDGDGYDDYIYLHPNGGTTIYRNTYSPDNSQAGWKSLPEADASGIGQRPEEISFYDINNDGKADYVWTSVIDGSIHVWLNDYPNKPNWLDQGQVGSGVGTSGANIRYSEMLGRSAGSYIAVDPNDGSAAAWLNGCDPQQTSPRPPKAPH